MTRIILLIMAGLAVAAPTAAQSPAAVSIRPFVMATAEAFVASDTFDASFGQTVFPFFGAGIQVVVDDGFFVEVGVSRFRQTGERAVLNNGTPFRVGIPLTATITPLEITGGYRFRMRKQPGVRPYVAAGFGSYRYQETSSFAEAGEDVDTTHSGFVLNGGAEFRVNRWVGMAVDVQYSHIPGILGSAGLSQQAGENDLGGVAARLKLVVGR